VDKMKIQLSKIKTFAEKRMSEAPSPGGNNLSLPDISLNKNSSQTSLLSNGNYLSPQHGSRLTSKFIRLKTQKEAFNKHESSSRATILKLKEAKFDMERSRLKPQLSPDPSFTEHRFSSEANSPRDSEATKDVS